MLLDAGGWGWTNPPAFQVPHELHLADPVSGAVHPTSLPDGATPGSLQFGDAMLLSPAATDRAHRP